MSSPGEPEMVVALDQLPVAAVLVGADGRVQHANAEAAALLGEKVGEALRAQASAALPLMVAVAPGNGASRTHDLVATVSHELRAPLTGVKGLLSTVLEYWDRFDDTERQRLLQMAVENADRMGRLLGELLDLSRLEAGRLSVNPAPIAVGPLIEGLIEHVVHAWIEGGGDKPAITAELGDLPPIMADGERLQQIFTNLIENALRYASPPIVLTAEVHGDWVTFVVSDSGDGITESDLARLFDKFFRRSGERRSGTGLGLYIVRGLVEAHDGKVWATSTLGAGSQFHVRLPR